MARLWLITLLFNAVVVAGASVHEDSISFLQVSETATRTGKERNAACTCLVWSKVYAQHNVTCGQGPELYFYNEKNHTVLNKSSAELATARTEHGEEFCTNFLEKVVNNYGMRIKFNTHPVDAGKAWYDNSWCYVSNTCDALNGGSPIPDTDVSWKVLEKKGKDIALSQLEPESILRGAKSHDYDLSTILGYSYYVSHAVNLEEKWHRDMARLQLPVVLTPVGRHDTKRLVKGSRSWLLAFNPNETAPLGRKWVPFGDEPEVTTTAPAHQVAIGEHADARPLSKLEQDPTKTDGCQCLEWERVYGTFGVKCGQGLEFYSFIIGNRTSLPVDDPQLQVALDEHGPEICDKFFTRMYNNNGVKISFNMEPSEAKKHWYDGSWCYVPYMCKNLRGGARIPGANVSWRLLEPQMPSFWQYSPVELVDEAKTFGYDLSVLAGYAWYTAQNTKGLPTEVFEKQARDTGYTVVLKADTGSQKIVKGNQSWKMTRKTQHEGHQMNMEWLGSWWNVTEEGTNKLLTPYVEME